MDDMGVVHMGAVEQLPQLFGSRWWVYLVDGIGGLTRGHVMSARSNTADTRHDTRQLFHRPALAELLEAAQLRYLEIGVLHFAVGVEKNLYLAVSLEPGNGVDTDFCHNSLSLSSYGDVFSSTWNRPSRTGRKYLPGRPLLPAFF